MSKTKYSDLKPDRSNANKGTERGRGMVERSLRDYGAGRSILVDKDGEVIAGNKTLEAAASIDLPLRVVETDGNELVVVKRKDLDLDSDDSRARLLAYADNRSSEVGLCWGAQQIAADVEAGIDLDALFFADELLVFENKIDACEMAGELADDVRDDGAIRCPECGHEWRK